MPSILKKEFGKVNRFFKKEVVRPTNKFFKKGGQAEQAIRGVASGVMEGSKLLEKGAKFGNQIIKGVEASPYGAALAPALGVARGIVGSVGAVGRIGEESGGALKGLTSGKGAQAITKDTLERAKRMEKESNKIKFK